ncbi:MAG: hydrophobic protein [Gaiellaceae bacterium]
MLLLVLLAVLALIFFAAGFVIKWLFIIAAVCALVWLISLFAGGIGRAGYRRW